MSAPAAPPSPVPGQSRGRQRDRNRTRRRLFVPFQRIHTKNAHPGIGIGLAIVKRIIDRHGEKGRVESTPGEGPTCFTLPAA